MDSDLRERVKEKAEARVQEELGDDTDSDEPDTNILTPAAVAERGWNVDDYNSFFADCRKDGYGASECGEMWTALKDDGYADSGGPEPVTDESADDSDSDETDVLVLMEDSDSSNLAAKYLSDPIMDGEIEVVAVDSDPGQGILNELDTVPDVPAHLVASEDGVRVGDLEALFERYSL